MNKVVCYVCGTSYPENATQCPICGYSRAIDGAAPAESGSSTYTYVKGGRYSKANVKKRNQAGQTATELPAKPQKADKEKKSKGGIVIVIILLLLAIVAAAAYITLRFFIPNSFLYEGLENLKLPSTAQTVVEEVETEPVEEAVTEAVTEESTVANACTAVILNQNKVQLDAVGSTFELAVTLEPSDTQDAIIFASSNEAVATVNTNGVITMVGEGTATITVTCADVSAQCEVVCSVPATEPEKEMPAFNRKEITFHAEGESWLLYDGEISAEDILWSSDDEAVATIQNGKVIAVADGNTTVYGTYEGETISCQIHCDFTEGTQESSSGISEAGADSKRTYMLYNPTGYADDVTLKVGDRFTLMLVDENKKEVSDAQWKVDNKKICSYTDSVVEALKVGTTEVTATYDGTTYSCVVRVVE